MIEQPTHYTDREGSLWKPWPKAIILAENHLKRSNPRYVVIHGLQVHALIWTKKGTSCARNNIKSRWDCVNRSIS